MFSGSSMADDRQVGKNTGIKLPLLPFMFPVGLGVLFCEKTGKYYSRSSLCYGGCFIFPGSAYRKCRTDP